MVQFLYESVQTPQQMSCERLDCTLDIIKTLLLHYSFTVIAPFGHSILPCGFPSQFLQNIDLSIWYLNQGNK